MIEEFERCYRAVRSRDARFDGWFYTGVTSTGIYCRPSCPAVTPKRPNVRFYRSAASAQASGFRACKRCRPDAVPGSPEWNVRADLAGRAMRLIADGTVDREGVAGLARRLGYTERHLGRVLVAEVGAGPLALARARRAHTARLLIETTEMPVSRVAFAAGFASLRQFNETVREVFAASPTELRRGKGRGGGGSGEISLRLPYRAPFDAGGLLRFLGERAVSGVEEYVDGVYRRTLRLPHGVGAVALSDGGDHVGCVLRLEDPRDLGVAVERCRRLLDLDADPLAVAEVLGADPIIGPIVRRSPGRRVPGSVDGPELATRAVLGQQVSVKGARTLAGRLVALCGEPVPEALSGPGGGPGYLFPGPGAVADADLEALGMPRTRREALRELARALADGGVVLDPGVDREEAGRRLVGIRGIGPWTASYVAMRALGDPDAFLPTDLGARRAIERLGHPGAPASVARLAEGWRPWRAYATQYLWASLESAVATKESEERGVVA
ncbi:helix-turn-helix domain-containing protein [Rubrobacter marinus]|uniref:DNA-3-methyladenine glycosylase II n=1 Tax=Rubrobacter marinus TaxID=2653852 RepID=A0A6G8PYZ3_9ACTN|nr:AlkA N-terminal domain-containing protein [Rubrobacter marinus]QIN79398.1 helix-turn-helix domain-containing protein [Rubrobacter marinus]